MSPPLSVAARPPVEEILEFSGADLAVVIVLCQAANQIHWNACGNGPAGKSGYVGRVTEILSSFSGPVANGVCSITYGLTDVIRSIPSQLSGSISDVADRLPGVIKCVSDVLSGSVPPVAGVVSDIANELSNAVVLTLVHCGNIRRNAVPSGLRRSSFNFLDTSQAVHIVVIRIRCHGSVRNHVLHLLNFRRRDACGKSSVSSSAGSHTVADIIRSIADKVYDTVRSIGHRSNNVIVQPLSTSVGGVSKPLPCIIGSRSEPLSQTWHRRIHILSGCDIPIRRTLKCSGLHAIHEIADVLCTSSGPLADIAGGVSNQLTSSIRSSAYSTTDVTECISDILANARFMALYPSTILINFNIAPVPQIVNALTNITCDVTKHLTSTVHGVNDIFPEARFMALHPATILINLNITPVPPISKTATNIASHVIDRLSDIVSSISNPLADIVGSFAKPAPGITKNTGLILVMRSKIRAIPIRHNNLLAIQPSIEFVSSVTDPVAYIFSSDAGPFTGFTEAISNPFGSIRSCSANRVPGAGCGITDILTRLGKPPANAVPETLLLRGFLLLMSGLWLSPRLDISLCRLGLFLNHRGHIRIRILPTVILRRFPVFRRNIRLTLLRTHCFCRDSGRS